MRNQSKWLTQPVRMNIIAMVGVGFVFVVFSMAGMWRFPGDTPPGWYWCFVFNTALLLFNIYALRIQPPAKPAGRLLHYVSLVVVVYIFVMLFQLERERKIEARLRAGIPIEKIFGND